MSGWLAPLMVTVSLLARMALYCVKRTPFWGDYGSILANGLSAKRDNKTGYLLLDRAGPFAPPMMFTHEPPVGRIVLVTQTLKDRLESANFGNLSFKPTIKEHIVSIPWETWDREARLPWETNTGVQCECPEDGEPENYILGQEHSPEAAAKMEQIWEFLAPELPCEIKERRRLRAFDYRYYVTAPQGEHRGLFRVGRILFVDDAGRRWFERAGEGWIGFDEVTII